MNSGSRFPTRFITFTVLTCFGSYLSGFGAFLELGRQFPGLKLLALALSAKTLLLALLATPFAKYCKNKSIYSSLYFSQLLGIVIALLEALAFFSGNNFLIVLAIVISGIPTLFIAILSGPILHEHSQDQDRFKTYQGIFQFITGISALIAGLLAPWCLNLISIFGVLALDIFSFCLALLVLARSKMLIGYKTALEVDNGKPEKEYSPSLFVWNSHKTRVVFLTSTIFFAIGLIPMFSASDLGKQFGYSGLLVESLWALESFAALVVGLAYSRSSFLRNSQIGIVVSSFSLIPILILGRIFSPIVLVGSFLVYSVLTTYGVMRTRDDFLASAANLGERIGYSGFHQVLLNILRTVSPFLLWLLASYARSDQTEINLDIIVWVQFGLCFVVWPFLILASRLKSRGFLKLYSLSIIGFSTFVLVLVVVIFSSNLRDFQKQQVRVWIETLPKSILPNLIESDYIPIEQKIELLRKTGLLNSFAVYNASGRIIAAFPSMDSVPGSISVPIKDDTDNGWGELRYLPDEYLFIRILFFPVILLTIALGLLGALLSKLLQINAHHAETQLELKRDRAVALNQIAVQVSHDIRSPLSALDIALMDTSGLSEERRLLIRNAVNRIRDIANNLLQKNRSDLIRVPGVSKLGSLTGSIQLAFPLVDQLMSEKRLQYKNRTKLRLELEFGEGAYGAFIKIVPGDFKTILSNLINNSVEASPDGGVVTVALSVTQSTVLVSIKDTGIGIPKEILKKIGTPGFSYNKIGGNGLGLSHAKEMVASCGGELMIRSQTRPGRNRGTTVSLTFPLAESPQWFVPKLTLTRGSHVLVVDDDLSVHEVWDERLSHLKVKRNQLNISHFANPKSFVDWFESKERKPNDLYLVDYEFSGFKETGLEIIQKLGIEKTSILVSSHYEEPELIERCLNLGVRLIPKGMATCIPVVIGPTVN